MQAPVVAGEIIIATGSAPHRRLDGPAARTASSAELLARYTVLIAIDASLEPQPVLLKPCLEGSKVATRGLWWKLVSSLVTPKDRN